MLLLIMLLVVRFSFSQEGTTNIDNNVQKDHTVEAEFIGIDKLLIRLSPYLINYEHGSMDLLFRTVDTVKSVTVDWGTSPEYENHSGGLTVDDRDGEYRYQYRMDNLADGQKYFYRINVDTITLEGSFYPAPETAPSTFTFYALGDVQDAYGEEDDGIWPENMGKDEVAHAVYNDIQTNPQINQTFVLHTGDLLKFK